MDENFCENDATESVDNGQKAKKTENPPPIEFCGIRLGDKTRGNATSDRCGSSQDASVSGTSASFSPLVHKISVKTIPEEGTTELEQRATVVEQPPVNSAPVRQTVELAGLLGSLRGGNENYSELENQSRMVPQIEKHLGSRRPSVGPPPSYSFVMKQQKRLKNVPSPDPLVINRIPPPTYTGTRTPFVAPEERTWAIPSFLDPIWSPHSQTALCPRCGVLVLTMTHAHDSIVTHATALALCLFGCWPCCLIPYCLNSCKTVYHYCPICQAFLGMYRPC